MLDDASQKAGSYTIRIDIHGDGLPQDLIVKPDRIICSLTELVPSE